MIFLHSQEMLLSSGKSGVCHGSQFHKLPKHKNICFPLYSVHQYIYYKQNNSIKAKWNITQRIPRGRDKHKMSQRMVLVISTFVRPGIKEEAVSVRTGFGWVGERHHLKTSVPKPPYQFITYRCQALRVWRFPARLMLAVALEQGMGRCLCGGRICPGRKKKNKGKKTWFESTKSTSKCEGWVVM